MEGDGAQRALYTQAKRREGRFPRWGRAKPEEAAHQQRLYVENRAGYLRCTEFSKYQLFALSFGRKIVQTLNGISEAISGDSRGVKYER